MCLFTNWWLRITLRQLLYKSALTLAIKKGNSQETLVLKSKRFMGDIFKRFQAIWLYKGKVAIITR